jgi:hypothetical protein
MYELSWGKLSPLLKNVRYARFNHYYYEIEFLNPCTFSYRKNKHSEPFLVDIRKFSVDCDPTYPSFSLFEKNTLYQYEFFTSMPIEIPKMFATPKDIFNSLKFVGSNRRIMDFQNNRRSLAVKLLAYDHKITQFNKKYLTDFLFQNITDGGLDYHLNLTDICKNQDSILTCNSVIYLKDGGYFRLYDLIQVNIKEALVEI